MTNLGKRKIVLITSGGSCLVALLTGLVGNLFLFAVLTFLLGGFHSMWIMAQMAVLKEAAQSHQRGRAIAVLGGVVRIGTFVGPIVGGFLGKFLGLKASYFAQALICLAALLFLYHYSRRLAWEPIRRIGVNPVTRIGRIMVRYRHSFVTAGPAVLVLQLLRATRQIMYPLWGDAIGLDVAAIGLVMGLSFTLDMMLFYPTGIIMDRWGRKSAAVPALLLFSLSMALIPLTNSFWTLLLVGLLTGVGNGLSSGLVMTIGSDLAPVKSPGDFLGVWRLIGDVGTASGPFIIGTVAQIFTLTLAPLVTGGVGLVGAFMFLFLVKETLKKNPVQKPES
jgi:MFS family permease